MVRPNQGGIKEGPVCRRAFQTDAGLVNNGTGTYLPALMKRLIVTADDFGLSVSVNEAVEDAHRNGILTCASLMVAGPAAADAVARARRLPGLGVGLHLVLVDGAPVLPAGALPALAAPGGRLTRDIVRTAFAIQFRPDARRQMESEVHAQFDAFRRTGLPLDHVNGHHHFHLHPRVADAIVAEAREFNLRAVRVPYEPPLASYGATGHRLGRRLLSAAVHGLPAAALRRKLRCAGLASNDFIFGLADSGAMTRARVLNFLTHLPPAVSELYFHPDTSSQAGMQELAALTDKDAAALARQPGIELITFAALARR